MKEERSRYFLFIFFLAFILAITFSTSLEQRFQDLQNAPSGILFDILKNWQALAILSLAIAVFITALLYMLGDLFNLQILKYYFRIEVKELLANTAIVMFLIIALAFVDFLVGLVSLEKDYAIACDPQNSYGFCLDNFVFNYLKNSYLEPMENKVIEINKEIAKSQVTLGFHIGIENLIAAYSSFGYEYDKGASSYPKLILRDFFEFAYIGVVVSFFTLKLSTSLFGPAILAVGILLRIFIFSRRIGSTLIAVGLGIMLFYPTFMFLFYFPFFQPISQLQESSYEVCPSVCFNNVIAFYDKTNPKQVFSNEIALYQFAPEFIRGETETFVDPQTSTTFYSCEYYARELGALDYANDVVSLATLKGYSEEAGFEQLYEIRRGSRLTLTPLSPNATPQDTTGLYCFEECRTLPYPDDSIQCRDAERACKVLYDNYPQCFKKMYAYENEQLYNEIFELSSPSDDIQKYEIECPTDCRSLPNIVPGTKDSFNVFCPTQCRSIDAYYTGSNYILKFDNYTEDVCFAEYNCFGGNGWYEQSKGIFNYEDWSTLLINRQNLKNYFEVVVEPLPSAYGTCSGCENYPTNLRYYPTYVDCSLCANRAPLVTVLFANEQSQLLDLGKVIFATYGIPLLALIATIYSVAGFSSFMEGDMFLPAINKLFR